MIAEVVWNYINGMITDNDGKGSGEIQVEELWVVLLEKKKNISAVKMVGVANVVGIF